MSEPFLAEVHIVGRLINKLSAANLAQDEAALLGAVFTRAAGQMDEVAGFDARQANLIGTFPSRNFKGSDEELQVLVDWLLEINPNP